MAPYYVFRYDKDGVLFCKAYVLRADFAIIRSLFLDALKTFQKRSRLNVYIITNTTWIVVMVMVGLLLQVLK